MKKLSIIVSFVLLFMVFACQPEPVPPTTTTTGDYPDADFGLDKQKLLDLVNAKRASGCNCGSEIMPPVSAVTWNNRLATAAYKHSKDMNDNNYFDHTSLDGKTPDARIKAEGYNWQAYGENIAKGQTTEQQVFDDWMASSGHCKNIMSANFTQVGMGRVGDYWTQDFGKPF